jgi:phosphatidylglycerol:prolipoprotein diacylglycerol transferase
LRDGDVEFRHRHLRQGVRGPQLPQHEVRIGQRNLGLDALGRIGCQLAGDGDWGAVSDVPWAMAYPHAIVGWPHPPGVRVHPTPIYEMLAYFAVFALLWSLRKRPHPDGTIFWWYLVLAPAARFVIEFYRINPPLALGLSAAQWFSLLLVGIGAWRLLASRGVASAPVERLVQPARR